MPSYSSKRATPQTAIHDGMKAVPATPTNINAVSSWVFQIVVSNSTSTDITFNVQDLQVPPMVLLPQVNITKNTAYVIGFPEGVKLTDGIKWSASAAGLAGEIFGFQTS
jgi:hypothetical protein